MRIVQNTNITWIDFPETTEEDFLYLKKNFDIHPLAIDEFSTPTYRPRATKYPNCLFLSIHIPLFDRDKRTTYSSEVDIIITSTYIITGHKKLIFQIKDFMQSLEKESQKKLFMSKTPAHLLHELLRILIESCFPRLDHIAKKIDIVENKVFQGEEHEMVREISILKRDVLNFRRAIMPQKTVLESILRQPEDIVAQDIRAYYDDLLGTNIRLWNTLESSLEIIKSLEETNNSLLSQKINKKMKVLTIFSVTTLPVSLYVSVYAISQDPFMDNPYKFWIHVCIMLILSLGTLSFFKISKWF